MIPKQCIIIGGGSSIRPDRSIPIKDLEVWSRIKNKFTIGINFSYKFFSSTIQLFGDYDFYYSEKEKLDKLPLVIGKYDRKFFKKDNPKLGNNILLIKDSTIYNGKESLKKGVYTFQLCGLASISLAIGLGYKCIFLLGTDANDIDGYTHFYNEEDGIVKWKDIKRCGVGKIYHHNYGRVVYKNDNYEKINELNNYWYKPFEQCKNQGIEIFNVSTISRINTFPKINYNIFYSLLNNEKEDQELIRNEIKKML